MARPKSDEAKKDEPKSRRAERRAAERLAGQRAEEARTARRDDAERWGRLLIIGIVVAVILIAIGFIAFGWYQTQIKPLGKTVLRVEDTEFDLGHLERRMQLEREQNFIFAQGGEILLALPGVVLDQLELEGVLLEGLGELDISVSDEDVAAEIRERGGLAEEVDPSLFAQEVRRQVEDSGLKKEEYEQMLRAELLEEKARAYFLFLGPREESQVRARLIALDDEAQAEETLQRLEAGEDFATVAEEVSPDQGVVELDWTPRGDSLAVLDEVEDFLFEAEPGERSGVLDVSAVGRFYIAELLERDDARSLDEAQREQVAQRDLTDWLRERRATLDIDQSLSQEDEIRALNDIL